MDVLQKPVSPDAHQKMEAQFTEDLMRLLLHIRFAEQEASTFGQTPFLKFSKDVHPLGRFSRELFSKLKETSHKIQWFIGVAKKILGPAQADLLTEELDLDGHKINNVAQLTGWIATSKHDLTDEIDLVTNRSRRKELLWKCWQASRNATAPEGSWQDFTDWHETHYPRP